MASKYEKFLQTKKVSATPPVTDIHAPIGIPIGQRMLRLGMPQTIRGTVISMENTQQGINLLENILPGSFVIKIKNVKTRQPNAMQVAVVQSFEGLALYGITAPAFSDIFYVPSTGGTVATLRSNILSQEAYNEQVPITSAISAVWIPVIDPVIIYDNVFFASTSGDITTDPCDLFLQLPQVAKDVPYLVAYLKSDAHVATATQMALKNYYIRNVQSQYGGSDLELQSIFACEIQNGLGN